MVRFLQMERIYYHNKVHFKLKRISFTLISHHSKIKQCIYIYDHVIVLFQARLEQRRSQYRHLIYVMYASRKVR